MANLRKVAKTYIKIKGRLYTGSKAVFLYPKSFIPFGMAAAAVALQLMLRVPWATRDNAEPDYGIVLNAGIRW